MCYNSTFIMRMNIIMCIQFLTITSSIFDSFFMLTITTSYEHGEKRSVFHSRYSMCYHRLCFHIIVFMHNFVQ